jgi:magnesium-transporting ATPase (P-type)
MITGDHELTAIAKQLGIITSGRRSKEPNWLHYQKKSFEI